MRTKALFVAAALGAAGIVSSMAQVYSVNVVGYVNVNIPTGFSLVANPLDAASNLIQDLMPEQAVTVYKYTGTAYLSATFIPGANIWTGDNFEVAPGEGFWVNNNSGAAFTVTFVGEITEGLKQNPIPQGFAIRSSIVPQAGTLSALGWPAAAGDAVYQWVNNGAGGGAYVTANNLGGGLWVPSEPEIGVGESFFVNKAAAASWDREFSVGP
jgi:hypothetical protein